MSRYPAGSINGLTQNYLSREGALIEDFETIGEWADYGSTGGTFVADAVNFKTGTQSLKWGSSDTTIRKRYKYYSGGVDWSDGEYFDLWVYFPEVTATKPQIQVYVATQVDAAANLTGAGLCVLGAAVTGTPRKGINHWRFKKSDFSGTLDWSHVYNILINLNPLGGAQEVSIDALYLNRRARPKVIFTLDDASLNQYTAYTTYLNPKGIEVSIFCNGSTIDTGGVTTANLQSMEANGSEVCNHTYNHVNLTTLATQAEQEAEIQLQIDWMKSKGFKNWNLFAYPEGAFNDNALAAVEATGMKWARSLRGAVGGISSWQLENNALGVANKYAINSLNLNNSTSLAQAKAAVDESIAYGGTIVFYAHKFDTTATGDTWTNSDLDALTDYVLLKIDSGLVDNDVLGNWFNGLTNGVRRF